MSDGVRASNKKSRIREAMETVLKAFKSNPEKVALAVFKGNGKPSDSWSFFNRLIMLMNNTADARGFRQWQKVGRKVKKGAKAFYILAPFRKKVPVKVRREEERINENGETEIVEIEETIYVDSSLDSSQFLSSATKIQKANHCQKRTLTSKFHTNLTA